MKPRRSPFGFTIQPFYSAVAILCAAALVPGTSVMLAQQDQAPAATTTQAAPKIPDDQLDSLVAPIALYPDPLLSQVLVASTYPLEIIQLQQWLVKNKNLKDKALADAVQKQNWDPGIQSMAALPDAVKKLSENIQWTTDLGNAFLAQQSDVMDAVQRMRAKAQAAGNLKSGQQQKVETKVVETKTVIVIAQANPQVVYVPSYNPVVVYGPPVYPYPPIYYPPATGAVLAFGAGIAIGAAWGGGWGYGCGWGTTNTVKVNVNNTYVNSYNKTTVNSANVNSTTWQHNSQYRGGTPYSNQATATKYSSANGTAATAQTARGGSAAGVSTQYGNTAAAKTANGNAYAVHDGNVYSSSGNSSKSGSSSYANSGSANTGASTKSASSSTSSGANRSSTGTSSRSSSSGGGAFGGGGMSGSSAKSASSRGGQSMGGGGFSRGGGGGGRSGGGRRR